MLVELLLHSQNSW